MTVIKLCRGTRVQPNGSTALVFRDLPCRQKRQIFRIDTKPELDRNRYPARIKDCGTNNVPQEILFEWYGGTATLASNFWNRTSEIHVQVIDTPFVHQTLDRFGNIVRVGSV